MKKKKKSLILKIIGGSTILTIACAMVILICVLMIFDFFGTKLTKEKVQHNEEYADAYTNALNKYLKDGYVPLQRLLYFHLEDTTLTLEALYAMNLNKETKSAKEIESVCTDQRVKNMTACTEANIKENEDYLIVSTGHFNFPLKADFTVTSFFNQERTVYGKSNKHNGWDLAVPAQTPVYSVCSGIVEKVNSLLSEEFEVEAEAFTPEANVKETLSLDSLSLVDLVAIIQQTYKIKIPVSDLREIKTFNNLYDYIESHLPA